MDLPTLEYERPKPPRVRWAIVAGGALLGFLLSGVLVSWLRRDGPLVPLIVLFSPAVFILIVAGTPGLMFPAMMTISGTALFALYALAGCSEKRGRNLFILLSAHLMCLVALFVLLRGEMGG